MNVKTSLEMSKDISKPEQLITEHIDIWTSSILAKSTSGRGSSKKYELYGITKLRGLILDLAVRGKLVPQDANDKPASVLLEKIAIEKAQLIKDKKIKKSKILDEISEDEKHFKLPLGWKWSRLGTLAIKLTDGSHNPPKDTGKGYPMLSGQNINFSQIDFDNPSRYVDFDGFEKENQRTAIKPNDVLLTIVGSIGRSAVVPLNTPQFVLQRSVAVIDTPLVSEYLITYFAAPVSLDYYTTHAKGTAQKGIYLGQLSMMPIAVPPTNEQQRIVAKVDELMLLCDQLEQQAEASIDAHATLVEVLLATLTDSADTDELTQNWARVSEHFDSLFTTEQSIEALKQTVLQLAVIGKLVPQNPNDEPASVLLEKIAEEKEQLIKDKVIKKEKPLPAITDDEKPFELQTGWTYLRGELLADFIDPQPSHRTPPIYQNGTPYIGYSDISHEHGIDFRNARKVSPNVFKEHKNRYKLKEGDFVFGKIGTLGQPFFLPQPFDYCLSANLILIQPNLEIVNPKFLSMYLDSPILKEIMGHQKTNSTHGVFGIKKARLLVIPLPPLTEQHRIVTKVDELMAICDQLKEKLQQSQETQVQLTDALVDRALG